MNRTPETISMLERVRDHILEEPRRYDQEVVGASSGEAPCGTAACIYGWGAFLGGLVSLDKLKTAASDDIFPFSDVSARFGFDCDEEFIVCDNYGRHWPERFGEPLREAQKRYDKAGQARAAADYINWIIKTGKVTE